MPVPRLQIIHPGQLAMVALAVALVLADAHAQSLAPTTATGIGVWYQPDAPAVKDLWQPDAPAVKDLWQPDAPAVKDLWQPHDPGERLFLKIIVRDPTGAPVADAQVELW
ncbi:MAG: hypothetical protein OES09_02905, partial [Gammaproteobacteria bacterium]|nr:hypothetical protein [Gammaproteobacteria bacterium]